MRYSFCGTMSGKLAYVSLYFNEPRHRLFSLSHDRNDDRATVEKVVDFMPAPSAVTGLSIVGPGPQNGLASWRVAEGARIHAEEIRGAQMNGNCNAMFSLLQGWRGREEGRGLECEAGRWVRETQLMERDMKRHESAEYRNCDSNYLQLLMLS